MRIRKNKRGFYEKDRSQFYDWLLACVATGIVLIGLSYRLITIFF